MVKQVVSPYAELMSRAGVTQRDIAETLGKHPNTVNAWFTGKATPRLSLTEWKALAKLMHTKIQNLPETFAPQPIHNTSGDHE
jgi:putative transcriptional regulator